eukprot:4768949-Prymnesium_polylepis.1
MGQSSSSGPCPARQTSWQMWAWSGPIIVLPRSVRGAPPARAPRKCAMLRAARHRPSASRVRATKYEELRLCKAR